MFAVIFNAEVASLDDEYIAMAQRLRELAMSRYNCSDFYSMSEGGRELAISYWHSEADIAAWKSDKLHQSAQRQGKSKWYKSYSVQVLEVSRSYSSP